VHNDVDDLGPLLAQRVLDPERDREQAIRQREAAAAGSTWSRAAE
jgi:hypothetical protein